MTKTISKEALRKKLKPTCTNCTDSTITVYAHNILRLYRLVKPGSEGVPASGGWLKDKSLYKKFDSQKLSARRVLSVAAVKANVMYKNEKNEDWTIRMNRTVEEYEKQRDKRIKTPREQARWPTKGYDSLKTAAEKLKKEFKTQIANTKTTSDLYKVQQYIILKLYSEHALRLDWADVKLKKPEKDQKWNYLFKDKRKGWTLVVRKFKTEKFMGEQTIKVARPAALALTMFVPKVEKLTDHGFLLSTKGGKKLSRQGLSILLSRTTEKYMGKRISSQIIRVLKATKFRAATEKAAEVAKEMMHSEKQHMQYTKKKD